MARTRKTAGPETAILRFDPETVSDLRNLSAAVIQGDSLFLGSDEGASLELLTREEGGWGTHRPIDLAGLLGLEDGAEADIEGLAADDGWLWVVGSHARARPKIAPDADGLMEVEALAALKDTRPRCLLARLPLVPELGGFRALARDGRRRAGMLKTGKKGNVLAKALRADPLIGPFTRIAAKEGGVDIEGIAVDGNRIALGMRGPVIRTYALLLEIEFASGKSGRLKLAGPVYKRLLDLEGLGIRDLKRSGPDLLILAGPTTGLDGPCRLYRWRDWRGEPARHEDALMLHRPELLMDLPYGRREDHPEGLALLDSQPPKILLICDGPGPTRLDAAAGRLVCDIFELPA